MSNVIYILEFALEKMRAADGWWDREHTPEEVLKICIWLERFRPKLELNKLPKDVKRWILSGHDAMALEELKEWTCLD